MITVSELRKEVGLPPERDNELSALRLEVISLFEKMTLCLWNEREDHIETILPSGINDHSIWIELENVVHDDIEYVKEKSLSDSTFTTVTAFKLLPGTRRLVKTDGSTWNEIVEVKYTGGYSSTTCPGDIKRALIIQARYQLERHAAEKLMVSGASVNGATATFHPKAFLHPYFDNICQQYKRKMI